MGRYLYKIIDRFKHQAEKGISKYGQTLEDNPRTDPIIALEYLAEELTDGLMYLEELKEKLPADHMGFNQYQQQCERTANRQTTDPFKFLTEKALGIIGEAGEIGDYLKKVLCHGHPMNTEKLTDEAGDLLWYLSTVLTTYGITLEKVALHNIEKLKTRYPEGFTTEASINRKEARIC